SWTPADGLSCSDCPDPVARPTPPPIYPVTGIDDPGCFGSDAVTVVVGNTLVASVSDAVEICRGDRARLVASGGCRYRWSPDGGLSCTDCPDPIASPAATTIYTVVVSGGTCADSAQITVTVRRPPKADVSGDITICRGTSAALL